MLTELRLLILEDAQITDMEKRLPDDEKAALYSWYGREDGAVSAFVWCVNEGACKYGTDDWDEELSRGAAALGVDKETLAKLYETHGPLCRKGKEKKRKNINDGRFIVLEGLDGSGKTTHIKHLFADLCKEGCKVYATAEPTSSSTGGLIRDTLGGHQKRSTSELAALFLADRIHHNVNEIDGIRKFVSHGVDVISDRYYYSSLAYQGVDSDIKWVADMNLRCPDIRTPDVCIFLDLPAEKCVRRMNSERLTSEIYESMEMIKKVKRRFADTFRMLNENENIYIINADRPMQAVSDEILDIVKGI